MTTGTMTTMTGTATTEPPPASSRWGAARPGLPVRFRIALAVALLVGVALTAAGAILLVIGTARVEERVHAEADQEIAEFTGFQQDGVDPDTGEAFESLERLMRVYLSRNVPSDNELMAGYWDGALRVASRRDDLLRDPRFQSAVDRAVERRKPQTLQSEYGQVYLDALPVRDPRAEGAFVVAFFVDDELQVVRDMVRTYAVAALGALAAATLLAAWLAGRLLSPVRVLRETAEEISETDLSRRIPESGNDDLTDLTRTVNAMLSRLERAFRGQREFLDDAGHELRTPLTILRGHLELLDGEDPAEVDTTRTLLLDEVDRMSRLVDDLILLTKADQPGFVRPEPVDLEELTAQLAHKVRGLGDRTWVVDSAARRTVLADEQRLTQALLQLAHNAIKHTTPGDDVGVGSEVSEGCVRLWVRDTGPGVADEDKVRIFERFARRDGSEISPHLEGFGLGLSLVSAIAAGHGGRAYVEDVAPTGARFVVEIPLEEV